MQVKNVYLMEAIQFFLSILHMQQLETLVALFFPWCFEWKTHTNEKVYLEDQEISLARLSNR